MNTLRNVSAWGALALGTVSAAGDGVVFDYRLNGADWKNAYPDCGKTNQSPINLSTKAGSYKSYASVEDAFVKNYSNQYEDVMVKWTGGKTTQVGLEDGPNTFTSQLGKEVFGAKTTYNGAQFHFHAGSEHTVDGKRMDFEMHTVHVEDGDVPNPNGFTHAAMGIMFSVNDHTANLSEAQTKIIDTFFETLQLSKKTDPLVDMVTYGDLLMMVDTENRWVYKGSVTTPPCHRYVYWNLLQTVYPIKQKHLDLFLKQLERGEEGKLAQRGNWRETQPIDLHNIISVNNEMKGGAMAQAAYNINVNIYNQNSKTGSCSSSSH